MMDSVLLSSTQHIYARAGASTSESARPPVYKVVGIILAVLSGVFIGISFVLKKHGLLKANDKYKEVAGEGFGYLRNVWWWSGMTLMIIGEICNFCAYAFVDAIVVTILGVLSVVICTILSAIFLKERLSFVGKVGCFNCIVGSVVIVINSPEQSAVANIQDMKRLVLKPGFLSYAGVIIIACLIIAFWAGPRYGKKSMMVYLSICSLIGGLSVVATQGLGAAIVAQISGKYGAQFKEWFLYLLLVFVISTLLTEIIYLNKALNLFNAALVTPTYYVFFTSSTIVTSAVLFQGFKGTPATITTVIFGFLVICSGVVLLQLSKSAKDVPDTAVFKGDLDQVRTVAEQEEPEYEPRADTIRGGAAILRSMSKARSEKQVMEAKKLKEEHMQPIGEGEQVHFDGIRRRKTVVGAPMSSRGTLVPTVTEHPPLGMSQFPEDDDDDEYHPGFFQRLRSRGKSQNSTTAPVGLSSLSSVPHSTESSNSKTFQQDTSYRPQTAVHFDRLPRPNTGSGHSTLDTLEPPRPPIHTAKRQFSFQNVFGRSRAASGGETTSARPVSRHSRKESHDSKHVATEEERLGLVKGDSRMLLPTSSRNEQDPLEYSDRDYDWGMSRSQSPAASPGRGPSRSAIKTDGGRIRRVESDSNSSDNSSPVIVEKDLEKGEGGSGRAFL